MMRDGDVRDALHRWLLEEHRDALDQTRIVDELSIAGQVRVDTAVLNGSFSGFEIKSETDTLRRLPRQIEVYSAVLDYATLVVAKKHAAKARMLLPRWWGVIEATQTAGTPVELRISRKGRRNPGLDPLLLCSLLWKDEALSELAARGADGGYRSKTNRIVWQRLTDTMTHDELRDTVRERLKARSGWRAEMPSLRRA